MKITNRTFWIVWWSMLALGLSLASLLAYVAYHFIAKLW